MFSPVEESSSSNNDDHVWRPWHDWANMHVKCTVVGQLATPYVGRGCIAEVTDAHEEPLEEWCTDV